MTATILFGSLLVLSALYCCAVAGLSIGLVALHKNNPRLSHIAPAGIGLTCLAMGFTWRLLASKIDYRDPAFYLYIAGFTSLGWAMVKIFNMRPRNGGH